MEKRSYEKDASEDLLFYFLELKLNDFVNKRRTHDSIFQKAIKKNEAKFCKLFKPKPQGGFTFQLLDNGHLSNLYCELCN